MLRAWTNAYLSEFNRRVKLWFEGRELVIFFLLSKVPIFLTLGVVPGGRCVERILVRLAR